MLTALPSELGPVLLPIYHKPFSLPNFRCVPFSTLLTKRLLHPPDLHKLLLFPAPCSRFPLPPLLSRTIPQCGADGVSVQIINVIAPFASPVHEGQVAQRNQQQRYDLKPYVNVRTKQWKSIEIETGKERRLDNWKKKFACSNLPPDLSLKEQYKEMAFKSCACLPHAGVSPGFFFSVFFFFKASITPWHLTPYSVFHYGSITRMENAVSRRRDPLRAEFQLNGFKQNVGKYSCSF